MLLIMFYFIYHLRVSLKVGIITCVAGIVGVWLGAEIAWRYRTRNRKADALVCAVALIGSSPFLYGCLVLASTNIKVTYVSKNGSLM